MKNEIPSAFIAKPGHCEKEGGQGVIGTVVVIDTSVCHWCCDKECLEYIEFHKAQVKENRGLRKVRLVTETAERPELEL